MKAVGKKNKENGKDATSSDNEKEMMEELGSFVVSEKVFFLRNTENGEVHSQGF